jgi:hypothetical protein
VGPARLAHLLPWELRLSFALPIPAGLVGALIALSLFGVYGILAWASGNSLWDFDDQRVIDALLD